MKIGIILLIAFQSYAEKIFVAPINIEGDLSKSEEAVNRIFRESIQNQTKQNIISDKIKCDDNDCAIKLGLSFNADKIIYGAILPLGNNLVFTATILKMVDSSTFSQRVIINTIEDIEGASKRIASSLLKGKSIEDVVEIENVTNRESQNTTDRRKTVYKLGIMGGFSNHLGGKALIPIFDGFATNNFSVGFVNKWDYKNNSFASLELNASDIQYRLDIKYGMHVLSGDITPYFSMGLGAQFVNAGYPNPYYSYYVDNDYKVAPTIIPEGGLIIFNTYGVSIIARSQCLILFAEGMRTYLNLDIGVLFKIGKNKL